MPRIRSISTREGSYVVGRKGDTGARITQIKKVRGGYKVISAGGGDTFIQEGDVREVN